MSGGACPQKPLGLRGVSELEHLKMSELGLLQSRGILPAAAPISTDHPPGNPVGVNDPPKRFTVARKELFPRDNASERSEYGAWKHPGKRVVEPNEGRGPRPDEIADHRVAAVDHPGGRRDRRPNTRPEFLERPGRPVRPPIKRIELGMRRTQSATQRSSERGLPRATRSNDRDPGKTF